MKPFDALLQHVGGCHQLVRSDDHCHRSASSSFITQHRLDEQPANVGSQPALTVEVLFRKPCHRKPGGAIQKPCVCIGKILMMAAPGHRLHGALRSGKKDVIGTDTGKLIHLHMPLAHLCGKSFTDDTQQSVHKPGIFTGKFTVITSARKQGCHQVLQSNHRQIPGMQAKSDMVPDV